MRELCGEAHDLQANIVGCCLSQSVNAPIRGALKSFGIYADEHVALDYTLSRNADTGAVTIRYSSPGELPVKFSWTCTVNVDGTCSTTPIAVEGEMKSIGKIATGKAKEMVDDSVARLGLEGVFDKGKRELAVMYLEKYGGGLPATNARILSNYAVSPRSDLRFPASLPPQHAPSLNNHSSTTTRDAKEIAKLLAMLP